MDSTTCFRKGPKENISHYFLAGLLALIFSTDIKSEEKLTPERVLQAVLNNEELSAHVHPKLDGRVPLRVLNRGIAISQEVVAYGSRVVLIEVPDDRPYIEIREFSFDGDKWRISLEYAVEGIHADFEVEAQSGGAPFVRVTSFYEH